jgi:DNA-binding FadR family transcriptional regulator
MFQAVEPRRLYRQVAEQIRALIDAGQLCVGDRLPAERDLAEKFAVSRPTIREALIVLEVEGYVQIRVGAGIFVLPRNAGQLLPDIDDGSEGPLEVLHARCIVESAIAEEAARTVDPVSLAMLDANLKQLEQALDRPDQAIFYDRSFHVLIAAMTKNGPINRLTGLIYDQRMTPVFTRLASYFEGPHSWRLALDEHINIRDAIAAADPSKAREAMRMHLINAAKRFSESFGDELIGNDADRHSGSKAVLD